MCLFHKWVYVYEPWHDKFLGEDVIRHYTRFKVCKKCGKAMEYSACTMDSWWSGLDKEETTILMSKVKWSDELNGYILEKGGY